MKLSKKQSEQTSQILEKLYLEGPLTRAELSKKLNITPATMSGLASHLLAEGILTELGVDADSDKVLRRKIMLDVLPGIAYYAGVELSEDSLFLCVTDNLGEMVAQENINFETRKGIFELTEENVVVLIQTFLNKHSNYPIKAIGVAVPGHYNKRNRHILSNHPYWSQFDLNHIVSAFSVPVYIKNNVKCMALRELYLNRNHRVSNFLFLNLRKGMFAAYIYDNQIYGENNVLVGEIGHMVVDPYGELCECGKEGCLQTYASITWLIKKAQYIYEHVPESIIGSLASTAEELTLNNLITAYNMGDTFIKKIIDKALDVLALQINNSLMMLDLDAVYIHGRLFEDTQIAEKLMANIQQSPSLLQINRQITKEVKPYRVERGALGACALAIKNDFIGSTSVVDKR